MHSRMRPKYKPTINGRVVDLDLLYQIVTSHGGWEKVNMRNEWDELLEHFHLPRGTNGGLVIKQIYLKYLENYEKIYFLGEDGGAKGHHDDEDDYDDVRNRRRTASKMTSRSSFLQQTPSLSSSSITTSSSTIPPGERQPQCVLNPLSDSMREQLGLTKKRETDYDKLILSLQSPLPNEQDMAISVCTLLCNETKHVLRLQKSPSLLTYILAHAGIYRDCGLREVMEETYAQGREMDLSKFWDEVQIDPEIKGLLCEVYLKKIQNSLGFGEEGEEQTSSLLPLPPPDGEEEEQEMLKMMMEEEGMELGGGEECSRPESPTPPPPAETETPQPQPPPPEVDLEERATPTSGSGEVEDPEQLCCQVCPCRSKGKDPFVPPTTLQRSHDSQDKVSKRVHQIALIIRNLSFEEDNALIMAENMTMLRYLLLTANCTFGSLMQNSLDTISNISKFIKLQDPSKDPISSILLSTITNGLFSEDRMKVICCLDTLKNLTKVEKNERTLATLMDRRTCDRLCQLLTLCDIMMLIYVLECLLAITGIGESVCNEIVRVKGSVASLISLVTVEAQSYGPKGCIQMRVVETYSGPLTSVPPTALNSTTIPVTGVPSNNTSQSSKPSLLPSTATTTTPAPTGPNSIQAIGLRTVSGQQGSQNATPSQPSSSSAASFANSPAPMSGTVAAVSVTTPQIRAVSQVLTNTTPQLRMGLTSASGQTIQVLNPPRPPASPSPSAQHQHHQLLQGKQGSLPPPVNNDSTLPVTGVVVNNNVNHNVGVKGIPVTGLTGAPPPQVSSHSLTQHVFTPNTSDNVTEETWATAWLRGGFDSQSGTFIEEGELYRMYSVARKKPPAAMLSQGQLIQCVKLVYGASVGPVVKNFGGTALSFIEGVRPKLTFQPISADLSQPVTVATNGILDNNDATHVLSVPRSTSPASGGHGAPSPLSPILKATLSRPATPKSPTTSKSRSSRGKEKKSISSPSTSSSKRKNKRGESGHLNPGKIMSPSSSAIRSLLASKVAQRQQKKLLQQQNKKSNKKGKVVSQIKMNGETTSSSSLEKGEESSASSSMNSIEEIEVKTDPSTLTFQGLLCNGTGESSNSKEHDLDGGAGGGDELSKNAKVKGMLVDLLERKVAHKDNANGLVGRGEIRISDKGLEMIKDEQQHEVGVGEGMEVDGALVNETLGSESQEPQKMTFYASPEVVPSDQNCSAVIVSSNTAETVLLCGGGGSGSGAGGTATPTLESSSSSASSQSQVVEVVGSRGGGGSSGDSGASSIIIMGDGTSSSSSSPSARSVVANNNININNKNNNNNIINNNVDPSNNGSSSTTGGGNDLLEKFNQFSDLIVVNPEQLGIGMKRSASTDTNNPSGGGPSGDEGTGGGDGPTPPKKPCLNGTEDSMDTPVTSATVVTSSGSVLQNALSASQILKSTEDGKIVVTTSSGSHMLPIPVRFVNAQNSQQITIAGGRQVVLQPGQIVLSTGVGGSSQPRLQGQIIMSKQTSASDQMAKAFILIPQQPNTTGSGGQLVQTMTLASPSSNLLSSGATVQMILSQLANPRDGVPPTSLSHLPQETLEQELPFMCEWSGCGYRFQKYQQVFMHAVSTHCPDPNSDENVRCEWGVNGCDPLLRKRFSLMTHLQDRHCSKQALELACYRRKNKIEPPPAPQQPAHHPGYAPNAAFHAIKRHALQYMNPKDMLEENEGPVTKSIRLTAALILRNLVNFSPLGRRMIAAHESHLSTIAMSSAESSRTLSQLLFDMSESSD